MARAPLVGLFDIGATHTRVAVARAATDFSDHQVIPTDTSAHGIMALFTALDAVAGGNRLTGLVGDIAAQIDRRTGALWHATNLPAWNGLVIGREFEQHYDLPVTLANDASVVGLGEAVFGAGQGYNRVMYQTVSTGVNAALIIGGQLDVTAPGTDIGEQLIVRHDGRVTTLEAATGGAALERQYGHPARQLASQALWRSEAKLLALGLYNSLLHWSPEVVVFGGSMMRDIELGAIETELKRLTAGQRPLPKLVHAGLGDNGGLYGALALARQGGLL